MLVLIHQAHGFLGVHELRFQTHLLTVDRILTAIRFLVLFLERASDLLLHLKVLLSLCAQVFGQFRV